MRLQAQTDPNPPAGSESLGHAAPLSERHPAVQERMEARVHLQKTRQHDGGLLLVRLKFTQRGAPALSGFTSRIDVLGFTSSSLPQVRQRLGGSLGKLRYEHRQRDAARGERAERGL